MTDQDPTKFQSAEQSLGDRQTQKFRDHVAELERLETKYGFNIDVAREVEPRLLEVDGSGPRLLAFWTQLYEGIAEQPPYVAFQRIEMQNGTICTGLGALPTSVFASGKLDIFRDLRPEHIVFTPAEYESHAQIAIVKDHDCVTASNGRYHGVKQDIMTGIDEPLVLGSSQVRSLKDQVISPRDFERGRPTLIFAQDAEDIECSLLDRSAQNGYRDRSDVFTDIVSKWRDAINRT